MSKVVFHAVLKSLDTMSEIAELDYRDSPVVSTELVKFLYLNTSVEAVDRLESVTGELSDSVSDISKSFASQAKTIQSVGNKHDELKKTVEGMKKRLDKLEK